MQQRSAKFLALTLILVTLAFASAANQGILHGIVVDEDGAAVTGLTAVVTQMSGTHPFGESQQLTESGEFVVSPTVGAYLIELLDGEENVVGYRSGINVFPNITTFQLMEVNLPGTCQPNLGYGHGGGMTLSVCGDDLSTANSEAKLTIYNATPNALVFVPVGLSETPTPFKGGTLVPLPWLTLVKLNTSNTGTVELTLPGGENTPLDLVLQVVDPNGPSFRFSNAIEVTLGV